MFCSKCGKQIEGDAEFCAQCGAQGTTTSPGKPKTKEGGIAEIAKYVVLAILVGIILKALNII